MEFVPSRQENRTFVLSMSLVFNVFTTPSMTISDAVEETSTNEPTLSFLGILIFKFLPFQNSNLQTRSSIFYFEKLFNMNTFYVRQDILLIFYLNEMWDFIIKDMAQSKKTKKNRVVIKQSCDNVFLLFKWNVLCICSKK